MDKELDIPEEPTEESVQQADKPAAQQEKLKAALVGLGRIKWPHPRDWSRGPIMTVIFLLALLAVFVKVATPRSDGTLFGSYTMRMKPIDRSQPGNY